MKKVSFVYLIFFLFFVVSCIKERDYSIIDSKEFKFNPNLSITNPQIINKLREYQDNNRKFGKITKNRLEKIFITNLTDSSVNASVSSQAIYSSPTCFFSLDSNYYFLYIVYGHIVNPKDTFFTNDFFKIFKPENTRSIKEIQENTIHDIFFCFEFIKQYDSIYWIGIPKEGPVSTPLNKDALIKKTFDEIKNRKK
jgi:hypothetical protein